MYSFEQRKQAIELYIKYGLMATPVIRELGYPNRHACQEKGCPSSFIIVFEVETCIGLV